jgi:biopolymer transport protein ExbD
MKVFGRKRAWRQKVADDLELLPLMNLFIVLIPMLMLSAVFIEVRAIEMRLPADAEASAAGEPLIMTVRITDEHYVVESGATPARVIPRGADASVGNAAWQQLDAELAAFAAAHPESRDVRIVAESTTRYDEIVAVMDLARAAGLHQAALQGEEAS